MSDKDTVTIHTDGASRGNPGPAAFGYVIERADGDALEVGGRLPDTTNNVAEYTAVVRALEHAREIGAEHVRVNADSELMVKQVNGEYRVKNATLKPLYLRIKELQAHFKSFAVRHVPRNQNARADKLCNAALDKGKKKAGTKTSANQTRKKPRPVRPDVAQDAIECLQQVARAWAAGDPNNPKPADVWEQLWSILLEGGVVK